MTCKPTELLRRSGWEYEEVYNGPERVRRGRSGETGHPMAVNLLPCADEAKTMRIIHVTPIYFPAAGGGEIHLKKLSERLAARGHHVTVLTANTCNLGDLTWDLSPCRSAGLPKAEVIGAVKVRRFQPDGGLLGSILEGWQGFPGGYRSSSLIFGKDGLELLLRKPFLPGLIPYLLGAAADIVASVNWGWPPAYHVYLARKLKRFRLVGLPLFHLAEDWCYWSIYKKMLASCDAVVANTKYEADFVQRQAPVRVEVAGVGIEPGEFEHRNGREIRARYRLGNRPVVGFVGRQLASKGAVTLLKAMRMVWKWDHEVRLILAGPRWWERDEVGAFIGSLTEFERERIVRIDEFPEKDKASLYDCFDVFVLPSTGESFGIAYLEAWMCRKPVIGARIGATQCVIDEGTDGLLVDPENAEDTARAIIALLSDSKMGERMGRSGHDKTVRNYTWDKVTDKIEKVYLELLAAK